MLEISGWFQSFVAAITDDEAAVVAAGLDRATAATVGTSRVDETRSPERPAPS